MTATQETPPHPNSPRGRGYVNVETRRKLAFQAAIPAGIAAYRLEAKRQRIVADCQRCMRIKQACHISLACTFVGTAFAVATWLYFFKPLLPYAVEWVAIFVAFVIAARVEHDAEFRHAELIKEHADIQDALHYQDARILTWFKTTTTDERTLRWFKKDDA